MKDYILQLTSTPDRAWLTLLAGLLLLCREFTAPGRVIPGVLGGIAVILAAFALSGYRLTVTGLSLLAGAIAALLVGRRFPPWYTGAVASAALATAAAFTLTVSPWRIGTPAAVSTFPVVLLIGFLLGVAVRARRNKFSDLR